MMRAGKLNCRRRQGFLQLGRGRLGESSMTARACPQGRQRPHAPETRNPPAGIRDQTRPVRPQKSPQLFEFIRCHNERIALPHVIVEPPRHMAGNRLAGRGQDHSPPEAPPRPVLPLDGDGGVRKQRLNRNIKGFGQLLDAAPEKGCARPVRHPRHTSGAARRARQTLLGDPKDFRAPSPQPQIPLECQLA